MTGYPISVSVMDTSIETIAHNFFDEYAQALLARDSDRIANLYAVPALIAFPEQTVPASSRQQTRDFFSASWGQYSGVEEIDQVVEVIASSSHSIWVDVTWTYGGAPRERFIYQLLRKGRSWRVGVLTPLPDGG